MSMLAAKRRLLLTQREFGLHDDVTFCVPWTIWAQLRSMFAKECHFEVAEVLISKEVARTVAEWIVRKHVNLAAVDDDNTDAFTTPQQVEALGWLTLLTLCGDDQGIRTAELADFLRTGKIVVEEVA